MRYAHGSGNQGPYAKTQINGEEQLPHDRAPGRWTQLLGSDRHHGESAAAAGRARRIRIMGCMVTRWFGLVMVLFSLSLSTTRS
jgi:hypothetical protein